MILLSNGGDNIQRSESAPSTIAVGTVDGVAILARSARGWTVKHRALQGVFISGLTASDDGTLFASTRGVGMARSDDSGVHWTWVNDGLAHHEFWSTRAGRLQDREVVFAGALPAHLYVSEDRGEVLARPAGLSRRQVGAALDLPAAAAHRPRQGHRARRQPAVGRRRDRLAAILR